MHGQARGLLIDQCHFFALSWDFVHSRSKWLRLNKPSTNGARITEFGQAGSRSKPYQSRKAGGKSFAYSCYIRGRQLLAQQYFFLTRSGARYDVAGGVLQSSFVGAVKAGI